MDRQTLDPAALAPLVALLVAVVVLSGCQPPTADDPKKAEASDGQEPISEEKAAPPLVEVEKPRIGGIRDTITLPGDLVAEDSIQITSRVSAVVRSLETREGRDVKKGDVLLTLDTEELALIAKQEELAARDAKERDRSSAIALKEAIQSEKLQRIAFEKAEKEYKRFQTAREQSGNKAFTQEEYENKKYTFEEAKLNHDKAELARERAEVEKQQAKIAAERAELTWERAQIDVKRCVIRSPIDGAISFLELKPGEMVQSGTHVVSVVDHRTLYTEVRVPQRKLSAIRVGQAVDVTSEVDPETVFEGVVDGILPTVDAKEGTVKVRIAVRDPEEKLRPGMYVTAEIVTANLTDALLIPKRARMFDRRRSIAFVVRDSIAYQVDLNVGLQTVEELQVVGGGVQSTDVLVVRGQTSLKDGQEVTIQETEAKGDRE